MDRTTPSSLKVNQVSPESSADGFTLPEHEMEWQEEEKQELERDIKFEEEKRFELSSLLGAIDSLSESANHTIANSTFSSKLYSSRKKLNKIFLNAYSLIAN